MTMSLLYLLTGSFLLGAIPFGYLIGRSRGVNLLNVGSGSTGATNVRRVVGKAASNWVFFLDLSKGCLAVLFGQFYPTGDVCTLPYFCLLAAMTGHCFSPFLRFRGGRGVAVLIGGLGLLMPNVLLIGLITWVAVFYATRFVSLASLCLGAILPLCAYLFGYSRRENLMVILLTIFIFIRHIANVKRLLCGSELRFKRNSNSK